MREKTKMNMLKQRNEKAGAKERKARKRACRGQKAAFEKAKKPLSYVEKIRSDADRTAIGLQKHCYQWAIALQSEAKSYANGGRLHSFWKADAIIHINKDCRDTYK